MEGGSSERIYSVHILFCNQMLVAFHCCSCPTPQMLTLTPAFDLRRYHRRRDAGEEAAMNARLHDAQPVAHTDGVQLRGQRLARLNKTSMCSRSLLVTVTCHCLRILCKVCARAAQSTDRPAPPLSARLRPPLAPALQSAAPAEARTPSPPPSPAITSVRVGGCGWVGGCICVCAWLVMFVLLVRTHTRTHGRTHRHRQQPLFQIRRAQAGPIEAHPSRVPAISSCRT